MSAISDKEVSNKLTLTADRDTHLPVAPEHAARASSISTDNPSRPGYSSIVLATEAPVIPDPMITTSTLLGSVD